MKLVANEKEVLTPEALKRKIEQGESLTKEMAQTTNLEALDLPSKYLFYPVDGIEVRDLRLREYIMIGAAQESGSYRSLVEAIAKTVINFDGMSLTYGDFQYLMYVQRVKLKKPFSVSWMCNGSGHNEKVEKGELAPTTLTNNSYMKRSNLEIINPNFEELDKLLENGEILPGLKVTAPTIKTIVESTEEIDSIVNSVDPDNEESVKDANIASSELRVLSPFAINLSDEHGKSFREKRKFLEEYFEKYDGDHYEAIQKFLKFEKHCMHGVKESVKAKCEECGHEQMISIRFEPTDFFPSLQ